METNDTLPSDGKRTGVTATLALCMLLATLGTSIANVALPSLAQAFAAPFSQVQAVVVGYLAALTVFVVVAGRLGDRYGLKSMLMTGLGVFLFASVLCSLAPNLWSLIGARAVQGVGAAFLMALSMALMRQMTAKAHIGRAMGLVGTMSALGTALGPSLGGLLLPVTGWRGIFWVQIPLAATALVLCLATLPTETREEKTPMPSLLAVLDGRIVPHLFVNMLVAAVMMTTLVVGPFYLRLGLGLTETSIGLVMAIGPGISMICGVPAGRLVDGWGGYRVAAAGLLLLVGGSCLLALLPKMIGVAGYALSIMVLTPGYQLFQAANNAAALGDVSSERRGTVSGLLNLSRNIGLMAGAFFMGAVFAFAVGVEDIIRATPQAVATGMQMTFLLATGLTVLSLGIAFSSGLAGTRR
ncbi:MULTISPECIES: MFS transporter [unclassified Aureimonas]|uniref:MFS transporter n=1 Tax=unclassified Aureimonas TaxID=2615206 RepID=UPI0006F1E9D5|nr:MULTISPECIES: MFS transporter [unclassified Aureimonas]KQT53867.1 MFS transporter [Aureimonas sp. Leaf427]KQT71692.1 MFS transporter [Aureimonas sp. Leaf460]